MTLILFPQFFGMFLSKNKKNVAVFFSDYILSRAVPGIFVLKIRTSLRTGKSSICVPIPDFLIVLRGSFVHGCGRLLVF